MTEDEAKAEEEIEASEESRPEIPPVTMIHVRFSADGSVIEISERPKSLSPGDWFNRLTGKAGNRYQALSGGRGLFRLPTEEVEALKSVTAN